MPGGMLSAQSIQIAMVMYIYIYYYVVNINHKFLLSDIFSARAAYDDAMERKARGGHHGKKH